MQILDVYFTVSKSPKVKGKAHTIGEQIKFCILKLVVRVRQNFLILLKKEAKQMQSDACVPVNFLLFYPNWLPLASRTCFLP